MDIPKRAITGVSGSGKSSLVFGTIAAESQRLINETYTTFLQSLMPNVGRPDVDRLRNQSAAILVDQERMGANSRSTVGTATDAYSMPRLIYSRLGEPYVGHSGLFSFNDPQGMCPGCEGMGRVSTVDVDAVQLVPKPSGPSKVSVSPTTPPTWRLPSSVNGRCLLKKMVRTP